MGRPSLHVLYYMNDISDYLSRQSGEGVPAQNNIFACVLHFELEAVCFFLHEHLKFQLLGLFESSTVCLVLLQQGQVNVVSLDTQFAGNVLTFSICQQKILFEKFLWEKHKNHDSVFTHENCENFSPYGTFKQARKHPFQRISRQIVSTNNVAKVR